MSGTIHKDCRRARSVFHHFPIISWRLQRFSAQQTVGQQRPLKTGEGSALSIVGVESVGNIYNMFFDLSAPFWAEPSIYFRKRQDVNSGCETEEEKKKEVCEFSSLLHL